MDFDKIVADHKCRSCIISVEKYQDGTYGNIRVVAAHTRQIIRCLELDAHIYISLKNV